MDPARFKAPFLSKGDIETAVEDIRRQHESLQHIPVDVIGFAEFDLGLEFEFAAIQQLNQDAFLRPDLTGIWFDKVAFREQSWQHRLRFSTAHELGHLFLHRDIYGALRFTTVKQWVSFMEAIPASEYYWIEWHADEFAGHLLMPTESLRIALDEVVNDAEREGFFSQGPEEVLADRRTFVTPGLPL